MAVMTRARPGPAVCVPVQGGTDAPSARFVMSLRHGWTGPGGDPAPGAGALVLLAVSVCPPRLVRCRTAGWARSGEHGWWRILGPGDDEVVFAAAGPVRWQVHGWHVTGLDPAGPFAPVPAGED
jgi:hypothetical protein